MSYESFTLLTNISFVSHIIGWLLKIKLYTAAWNADGRTDALSNEYIQVDCHCVFSVRVEILSKSDDDRFMPSGP